MFEGISTRKLRRLYCWITEPEPVEKDQDEIGFDEEGVTYFFVVRYSGNPNPPTDEEIQSKGCESRNFLALVQTALAEYESDRSSDYLIEKTRRGILLPSIHYIPGDYEGNCRAASDYFNGSELENSNTEYFFGYTLDDEDEPYSRRDCLGDCGRGKKRSN